jgi:hypothetical protein
MLVATVEFSTPGLSNRAARIAAGRRVEEAVRALPGVLHVAWSYGHPPGGGATSFGKWYSDSPDNAGRDLVVDRYWVGRDFFAVYGIPLLRGRLFEPSDDRLAVVVGERLARSLWPGVDPLGRTFRFEAEGEGQAGGFHVIGVVGEIHLPSLDARLDHPQFYQPFDGIRTMGMLGIRCGPACPNTAVVHQRILSADAGLRPGDVLAVDTLEAEYFEELARPRATAALAFAFAAVAVLAAAGGLFSVLSYAVGRRRREFGIRTALGASALQIRCIVLREGATVASTGLAIGAVTAWLLGRALVSLQYGVTTSDPVTWFLVLGLLVVTTVAASWRPASQAMRNDPVVLLREE